MPDLVERFTTRFPSLVIHRLMGVPGELDDVDPEWRVFARSAGDDKAPVIALAAAVGLLAAWFFSSIFPNYLLYATPAIEADAVVLFLGPGEEARRKQVDELVARGLAKFVILPYEGKIFETWVSKAPVNP